MKRFEFEAITVHADNEIKGITSQKNICTDSAGTTHYYITRTGADYFVKSSADFTIDDVTEDTNNIVGADVKNFVMRRWGNEIRGCAFLEDGTGGWLVQFWSDDDGSTWSSLATLAQITAPGTDSSIRGIDVVDIDGVFWVIYSLQIDFPEAADTIKLYALETEGADTTIIGGDLKVIDAVYAGFVNADGDYQCMVHGDDDKFYDVVFDGTSFTRTEITDDLTPPDTWDVSRQLYWDIRDRHIILTGNQMFQKLNGYWTLTSVAAEQDVVGIVWKKDGNDDYTFDYIFWNNGLYYVTVKGYLVKIQTLAVDARVGHDNWFSTGSAIWQNTNPAYTPANRVPISGGKYKAQTCTLLHIGTDYVKGSGIVLTDDSDNIKFIGVVDPKQGITAVGTTLQRIPFVSPGKFDLEEKISYEFLTKTIPEMRTEDFLFTRYYYEGTIDANATTYDYSCNQIPRRLFWKELDELGLKRTNKSNELGEVSMEDADVSSGVTVTHLNMVKPKPKIQPQGAGFNKVTVIGGNKPDGTGLAIGTFFIPTATDEQINEIIFSHPNRRTDALCLADATIIASNVSAALKSITCSFIGQGKPLEGTVVSIAYAPDGLSATNFIVETYTYELLTDKFRMNGLSALHWKGKDFNQLLEGTRAAVNQLAIDVGNLIEGGTIWYLDDTNSDIGGYESLNLVYDAAAEVDYSVANAVDGEAIEEFITAIGEPGITNLLEGQYGIHIHASKTGGVQNIAIYYEIYKRAHPGGGEVLLGTSHPTSTFVGADNNLATHIHLSDTALLSTDRIVIKFYASVSGLGNAPSFDMHVQGATTSRFQFPFILTGGAQPFRLKGVGGVFINRTDEPGTDDFDKTDLVDDLNWNDIDFSGLIDAGANAVYIKLRLEDGVVGSNVFFRRNGVAGTVLTIPHRTQVVNVRLDNVLTVGVDSAGKAEIKCSPKPTDWTTINITVLGWYV